MSNLPAGIPIPPEVHEQYAPNVKLAWKKFHEWWVEACEGPWRALVDPESMPPEVRAAFDLINSTSIPGRSDGATGADSCYMISVKRRMSE